MRDVAAYVQQWCSMVAGLKPARTVVLENDSVDGTHVLLSAWRPEFPVRLERLATATKPFQRDRSDARKYHLAKLRNHAIGIALEHNDWDWALMQDARKWSPRSLLERLGEVPGDVRAPMILRPDGVFYDTWAFFDPSGNPEPKTQRQVSPRTFYKPMMSVGGVFLVSREMLEDGCRYGGAPAHGCDSAGLCASVAARGGGVVMATHVASVACEPDEFRRLELHAWEAEEARAS
jgi:hypothetical protein